MGDLAPFVKITTLFREFGSQMITQESLELGRVYKYALNRFMAQNPMEYGDNHDINFFNSIKIFLKIH